MSMWSRLGVSLAVAMVMTVWFTWPLTRYATTGIPSSGKNIETGSVRAMIHGDHLQFLYHLWLGKDTFTGKTPLFHNLYEFNTGNDRERYGFRPYYMPFSLFFTIGSFLGSQALAWNFTLLIAVALTFWVSWKMANRYCPDRFICALLALLPVSFPFMWFTALEGSPTGMAMMWVPVLLYGIDRWLGDRRASGAALVGGAIFFSEWSDSHVFFFCVLLTPAWIVVTCLYHGGWKAPSLEQLSAWMKTSWPLLLFLALAGLKAWSVHQGLQDTAIGSGRDPREIDHNSFGLRNLIGLGIGAKSEKMHIGVFAAALLLLAFASQVIKLWRRPSDRRAWAALIVFMMVGVVLFLSTGMKNPLGPRFWSLLTSLVPPYGMIRQPNKIFCIVPALLVAFAAMTIPVRDKKNCTLRTRLLVLAGMIALIFTFKEQIHPTICLLDSRQGAYAAVVTDARDQGIMARAIALPLWPGNDARSSLYQYYASLYRIRMVNGYRPTARKKYVETIFEPLESMNLGNPSGAQLDDLLDRKINYVIFHENAFPELVSPYPAGTTLAGLINHARLELLHRDGPVWAFRIRALAFDEANKEGVQALAGLFPKYTWDAKDPSAPVLPDPVAFGESYVLLTTNQSSPVALRTFRVPGTFSPAWHLRVKGSGAIRLHMTNSVGVSDDALVSVENPAWHWIRIAAPDSSETVRNMATLSIEQGEVGLDAAIMVRNDWGPMAVGDALSIPAAAFFRAGYTLDDLSSVRLRTLYDQADVIFYGKNLYLESGSYRVALEYESSAEAGVMLGRMIMSGRRDGDDATSANVVAGAPALLEYTHAGNLYYRFDFDYARAADMIVKSVRIERIR